MPYFYFILLIQVTHQNEDPPPPNQLGFKSLDYVLAPKCFLKPASSSCPFLPLFFFFNVRKETLVFGILGSLLTLNKHRKSYSK